jgi:hypothetical protein
MYKMGKTESDLKDRHTVLEWFREIF